MIRSITLTKLSIFLGLFLFTTVSAFAQPEWSWKYFSPKNQPWTILAPGPMRADAEAQNPGGNKGSYTYNDFFGFFAVIYRDSPRRFLPFKPDYSDYMEGVRDDVVKANNGKLISDVEFKSRNITGREVRVRFPSGTTRSIEGQTITKYRVQRFRTFFIGRRFYVLLAVLPESEINTPMIDRYFDSFVVNTPPVASANSYTIDEDGTLTVSQTNGVLSNDTDAEQKSLTVTNSGAITQPANGSLTISADGSFTYKPKPNFNGRDSFTYKANDGIIDSNIATVTINVTPVNDAPTIASVPVTNAIDEMTALRFTVAADDIDNPPSSLRYSLSGAPNGASIDARTGAFSWTPTEAQGPGTFNFQVIVSDGQATASAPTSVTVREVNVAPQFSNAPVSSAINELEPYNFSFRAIDADIPNQSLTYSLINAPNGASINTSTGTLTWTPTEAQGDNSTYNFTVRVSDGAASADQAVSLTVKEVNTAPSLQPLTDQIIDELKPLLVTARATDNDFPANNLTYSLEGNVPAGMNIDSRSGAISWTPNESQGPGEVSVTVRASDSGSPSLSDSKTFRVRVNEINVAPRFNSIGDKTVDEETALNFRLNAADDDLPANTLTYSMTNAPAGATLDATTGAFSWTPTEAQGAGSYSVTFRVTDNGSPALSDSQTVTIRVNEVNKAPNAENATAALDEDSSVSITLRGSDVDLPANSLRFTTVSNPQHGRLSGSGANLTYMPNPDYNGTDSFTFKINDGSLDSNTATVNINVRPVNDNPVARPDEAATEFETTVDINVLANDSDVDNDRLNITGISNAIGGRADIVNGAVRFTPNSQFQGTASFSYSISDSHGGTASQTVTVRVNPPKPKN